MKLKLLSALVLFQSMAHAYQCPKEMGKTQNEVRAWFEPWRGTHELKNCRVEISVCTPGATPDEGSVLAEILITRADGREAYVPISINPVDDRIETRAELRAHSLWYIKRDKYYETEMGRTETSRLEIVLSKDGLRSVDLGMYATKKRLHGPSPSRWFNCGLSAE